MPRWPLAAIDAIDRTLFPGCSSPLVTLTSFWIAFCNPVTFCHILFHIYHILSLFVTFWITFCHLLTLLQLSVTIPRSPALDLLLLLFSLFLGIVVHKHKFILSCLCWWVTNLPGYSGPFLFSPKRGLGCFSDRSDWHLYINSSHHQHMTNVNIFHCCIIWSLFEGKVMKSGLSCIQFSWILQILPHTFF